jgi:hypothetical protein
MNLLSWRVFSLALLIAVALGMPTVTNAQDAQPMNEISLGSAAASGGGGGSLASGSLAGNTSLEGGDFGTPEGEIAAVGTAGPEAVAFDGTYVWVAMQFNNTITRVRVSDGAVAGTFVVGKRPVALL